MVCLVLGFVVSYGRYTHVFTYTVSPFEFVLTSMKETNVSIMYSHHRKESLKPRDTPA